MIIDTRRILGGFAIFALVLLRLVVGWHFLGEGTKKVEWDRHEGRLQRVFSADDFLTQAKGPLAPLYQGHAPSEHEWRSKLATPLESSRKTPDEAAELAKWVSDYKKRQSEATKKGEPLPVEFPPHTASHDWATKVADDWRASVVKFKSIAGLAEAQKQAADKALDARLADLWDYVMSEEPAIAEYRHELWRLANWREAREANDVPYYKGRIATKSGETAASVAAWREQVNTVEQGLHSDLYDILSSEQRAEQETLNHVAEAVADSNQHKLDFLNAVITWTTIGVGVCLVLGFFTRFASMVGALFLFGVIVSQPFWIPSSIQTINQCVELAALLVLAGTGAGRWAGMDGCLGSLLGRRRAVVVEET